MYYFKYSIAFLAQIYTDHLGWINDIVCSTIGRVWRYVYQCMCCTRTNHSTKKRNKKKTR